MALVCLVKINDFRRSTLCSFSNRMNKRNKFGWISSIFVDKLMKRFQKKNNENVSFGSKEFAACSVAGEAGIL